jgi:hypothetical protein
MAVGDLANCGCGVVTSMQPCCNRCGAMYYVRCNSGNTLSVCASSASAAETIGRANCQGSSIASVTDSRLFQKRRIPPLGPKATMRRATGDKKASGVPANLLIPIAFAGVGALVSKNKVRGAVLGLVIPFVIIEGLAFLDSSK